MKFIQTFPDVYIRLHLAKLGVKPVEFEFVCLKDFLRHPTIRYHTQGASFKKFSICRDKLYELIVELKDGRTYKIGELEGNISEIPEWVRDNKKVAANDE